MIYDDKVAQLALDRKFAGRVHGGSSGVEIELNCGTFVEFFVSSDEIDIVTARYRTNGCGYMIAAAEVMAGAVDGRKLGQLGGLATAKLEALCRQTLSTDDSSRFPCTSAAAGALLKAFAALRESRIAPLGDGMICSCFGVSEADIQNAIVQKDLHTVDDVGQACNAGTGCGSCRMLIQELLDHRQ